MLLDGESPDKVSISFVETCTAEIAGEHLCLRHHAQTTDQGFCGFFFASFRMHVEMIDSYCFGQHTNECHSVADFHRE